MINVTFPRDPGYIYDLFCLFILKFNKEYCLSNFINYSKSDEDTEYYNNLLNDFPEISEELRLFFHVLKRTKKSFMTYHYYEPFHERFLNNSYTLSTVQEELNDVDKVTENVIRYYFDGIDDATAEECKASLSTAARLIRESDYSDDIKNSLYGFFIDPEHYTRKLIYELLEMNFALAKRYEDEHTVLSELKGSFDFYALADSFNELKIDHHDISKYSNVCISFCLCTTGVIKQYYFKNDAVILLGSDYIEAIKYLIERDRTPDLHSFGHAMSEPHRVDVIDLMKKKGEITIKDLEQDFGFTGTNAYYHLSLMIRAGMLKTRTRGRTVMYSLNPGYFKALSKLLLQYTAAEEDM